MAEGFWKEAEEALRLVETMASPEKRRETMEARRLPVIQDTLATLLQRQEEQAAAWEALHAKLEAEQVEKEAQMVQSLRTQAAEHLQMAEKIEAAVAGAEPGRETVRAAKAMAEGFWKEAEEALRLVEIMASPEKRRETMEARRRNNEVHEQRQKEQAAAWEALRAKLEAEQVEKEALRAKLEAEQAIENAAREAREQLKAAMVMGVFVRRLLAKRKGGKLKQQRLLKDPDHIDKAIMNGQGRAKLAEMREQKEKMNEYITKMSC